MSANRRTFSNSGVRGVGDGISLWRGPFDILTSLLPAEDAD